MVKISLQRLTRATVSPYYTAKTYSGSIYHSIGVIIPLRYWGYIYDREAGLYYVSSRNYNPEICRFINADNVDLLGKTVEL